MLTVIGAPPPEEPLPDPCPDCGYEGCVCDQPAVRFPDDLVVLDPDNQDLSVWWDDPGARP